MLIYNKLTEIFADFRHFWRIFILLIFSYLHAKSSTKTAYRQHASGGGLEIIVNKKLRIGGGTRRRPRCKYQAVHIQLSFVPLRRSSRWKTASSPPPSTACQSGVYIRLSTTWERLVLITKQPVLVAFLPPMTLYCKYVNVRNSRYLDLFEIKPSTNRRTVLTR